MLNNMLKEFNLITYIKSISLCPNLLLTLLLLQKPLTHSKPHFSLRLPKKTNKNAITFNNFKKPSKNSWI